MTDLTLHWQRLVDAGRTCPRCGDTGEQVRAAAATLATALAPLGITVRLVESTIDLDRVRRGAAGVQPDPRRRAPCRGVARRCDRPEPLLRRLRTERVPHRHRRGHHLRDRARRPDHPGWAARRRPPPRPTRRHAHATRAALLQPHAGRGSRGVLRARGGLEPPRRPALAPGRSGPLLLSLSSSGRLPSIRRGTRAPRRGRPRRRCSEPTGRAVPG